MPHYDNDDDLFDYDPSEDSSTNTIPEETVTPLTSEEKTFFENIKDNIEEDFSTTNLNPTQIMFAQSFHKAVSLHIDTGTKSSSFVISVTEALDDLTEGRFSLLNYKNVLEFKISKIMSVLSICSFLDEDIEEIQDEDGIKELLESIGLSLSPMYVDSCFRSTLSILSHILFINRSLYSSTCTALNVEPKEFLFMEPSDYMNSEYSQTIELSNYSQNIENNIVEYLKDNASLLENVSSNYPGKYVSFRKD